MAGYEEAVQIAFREVSDALAAVDTLRRVELARHALAESSQVALRFSKRRWRAGVDDHLRYLDAQRSAFVNQMAYIQTSTHQQTAVHAIQNPRWRHFVLALAVAVSVGPCIVVYAPAAERRCGNRPFIAQMRAETFDRREPAQHG